MLKHHDPKGDWPLPGGCRGGWVEGDCPKGREIVYASFPEALDGFLKDTGYLPR